MAEGVDGMYKKLTRALQNDTDAALSLQQVLHEVQQHARIVANVGLDPEITASNEAESSTIVQQLSSELGVPKAHCASELSKAWQKQQQASAKAIATPEEADWHYAAHTAASQLMARRRNCLQTALVLLHPEHGQDSHVEQTYFNLLYGPEPLVQRYCEAFREHADVKHSAPAAAAYGPVLNGEIFLPEAGGDGRHDVWLIRCEEALLLVQCVLFAVRRNGIAKEECIKQIASAFAAAAMHWSTDSKQAVDPQHAQALACITAALVQVTLTSPHKGADSEALHRLLHGNKSTGGLREYIRDGLKERSCASDAYAAAELIWCARTLREGKSGSGVSDAKKAVADGALSFLEALLASEAVKTFESVQWITEAIHTFLLDLLRTQGGQDAVLQDRKHLQELLDLLAAVYNIDAGLVSSNELLGDLLKYAVSKLRVHEPAFASMVNLLQSLARDSRWSKHVWQMLCTSDGGNALGAQARGSSEYQLSWGSLTHAVSVALSGDNGRDCNIALQLLLSLMAACLGSCSSTWQLREWLQSLQSIGNGRAFDRSLGPLLARPVPHEVKAACCKCIAHLARSDEEPSRAAELWSDMKMSGAVIVDMQHRRSGVPNGEVGPQSAISVFESTQSGIEADIFSVESKAGDFPLAIAFLDAACGLLEAGAAHGEEMCLLRIAKDSLLGRMRAGSLKVPEQAQAYDVHAWCLRIVRLLLARGGDAGEAALRDIMSDGECLNSALSILGAGCEALSAERFQGWHGRSMERAVYEALELLLTGVHSDNGQQLATLLLRQRRERAALEFCNYKHSSDVQMAAILLLSELATRSERLVTSLMSSSYLGTIREGIATALYRALDDVANVANMEADGVRKSNGRSASARRRCDTLIDVALHGLGATGPAPRIPLAYVLAGYRPTDGSLMFPDATSTTLGPLLEYASPSQWQVIERAPSSDCALAFTRAAEAGLALLVELLDYHETADSALTLAIWNTADSPPGMWLSESLKEAAKNPGPWFRRDEEGEESPLTQELEQDEHKRFSLMALSLGAHGQLLDVCARVLHLCVPDEDTHRQCCEELVGTLLGYDDPGLHRVTYLLSEAAQLIPVTELPDPSWSGIDNHLRELVTTNSMYVYTSGEHADFLVDENALLHCARRVQISDDVQSNLRKLVHYQNKVREAGGARTHLLSAWQGVSSLIISRRFAALVACCGAQDDAITKAWGLTRSALQVVCDQPHADAPKAAAVAMICAAKAKEVALSDGGQQSGAIECIERLISRIAHKKTHESTERVYLYTALAAAVGATDSELVEDETHQKAVHASRKYADDLTMAACEDVGGPTDCYVKTAAIFSLCACLDSFEPESGALEASIHKAKLPEALLSTALQDANAAAVVSPAEGRNNSCVEAGAQALALLGRLACPRSFARSPEMLLECDALARISQLASLLSQTKSHSLVRLQSLALHAAHGIAYALPESQAALQQASGLLKSLRRPLSSTLSSGSGTLLEPSVALVASVYRKVGELPEPLFECMQALCTLVCDNVNASETGTEPQHAATSNTIVFASVASFIRASLSHREAPQNGLPVDLDGLTSLLKYAVDELDDVKQHQSSKRQAYMHIACTELAEAVRLHLMNSTHVAEHGIRAPLLSALDQLLLHEPPAKEEDKRITATAISATNLLDNGNAASEQRNLHLHFIRSARRHVEQLQS